MPTPFFLSTIKITDIIDVVIVAYLIYKVVGFFKNTRAFQLLKGIVLLLIFTQLSEIFNFNTISFILRNTMQVGLIAILIIFQPELRKALTKVGSKKFKFLNFEEDYEMTAIEKQVAQIKDACATLCSLRYGALIVIERDIKLGDIIRTGTVLNSEVSAELLINIFIPNTPLHDGAVVIGDEKIKAAACFLPLSQNENLSKELGTRHRAGLGITETTDSVSVIVSEETGKISVASDGTLTRNLSLETLEKVLIKAFTRELGQKAKKKNIVWRFKKHGK